MKALLHGVAMVMIVLVAGLALIVQIAHVDQQIDRITGRSEAGR